MFYKSEHLSQPVVKAEGNHYGSSMHPKAQNKALVAVCATTIKYTYKYQSKTCAFYVFYLFSLPIAGIYFMSEAFLPSCFLLMHVTRARTPSALLARFQEKEIQRADIRILYHLKTGEGESGEHEVLLTVIEDSGENDGMCFLAHLTWEACLNVRSW